MSAPVHFKQYGIDNLILKNANEEYYYHLLGDRELSFEEDNFVISDDFVIPSFGVAAFVQGGISVEGFDVKAERAEKWANFLNGIITILIMAIVLLSASLNHSLLSQRIM